MNISLKKKTYLWQKVLGGIGILVLVVWVLNMFQAPIKNGFYWITSPISRVFNISGAQTNSFFGILFNGSGIVNENHNLKQENQQLLSLVSLLQETVKQNQSLQSALQNTKTDNFSMLAVQTIGLDTTGDFLLINRGSADGISENMPVISSTKALYGKVYKVYKNFSQVMLISNKNSVVDAKVIQIKENPRPIPTFAPSPSLSLLPTATPSPSVSPAILTTLLTPIYGAIKGNGNLSLYLDLIPTQVKINPADNLVTSGLEGIFPKNLLIGKIISIDKNDAKPFQTAQVQPFFDIKNIDDLFIITDYKK